MAIRPDIPLLAANAPSSAAAFGQGLLGGIQTARQGQELRSNLENQKLARSEVERKRAMEALGFGASQLRAIEGATPEETDALRRAALPEVTKQIQGLYGIPFSPDKLAGARFDNASLDALIGTKSDLTEYQRRNLELQQRRLEQAGKQKQTTAEKDFAKYQALKKTDPEAAEQFGRKAGFVSDEGQELSVHLQKRLSDANDAAREASSNSAEFAQLADQIEKSDLRGGIFGGKWGETLKDVTGSQDAVSTLRKRYFSVRGSQVVKNLPPGAASDTDIELALKGFPTDNANKEEIASFLRGLSKLESMSDKFNTFKADYISQNGSERDLLKSWRSQGETKPTEQKRLKYNPQTGEFE